MQAFLRFQNTTNKWFCVLFHSAWKYMCVIFVLDYIFLIVQAEEDAEIEMGDSEMEDVLRHQLSHREVFLSRQYENINANTIRYRNQNIDKLVCSPKSSKAF